jgi:hypothetical protein
MENKHITILSHKQNILCVDNHGKSFQIKHQQGYQDVPAWCAETATFEYAVKGGLIVVIEVKQGGVAAAPEPEPENSFGRKPDVPTVEYVMSRGYSQEAAEKIVAEEQAKSDEGIWPYGAKLPVDYIPLAPPADVPVVPPGDPAAPNADGEDGEENEDPASEQSDAPNATPGRRTRGAVKK